MDLLDGAWIVVGIQKEIDNGLPEEDALVDCHAVMDWSKNVVNRCYVQSVVAQVQPMQGLA
jgi:IMP cyclohydrolase